MNRSMMKQKIARGTMIGFFAAAILAAVYYFAIYNSIRLIDIKASYMTYYSAEEMEKDAELIIIGFPSEKFEDRIHVTAFDPEGSVAEIYTLTDLKIKAIIKKPDLMSLETGQSIQIIEPIGLVQRFYGKEKWKIEGYDEMEKDNVYIVFLKANLDGIYSVINMNSGRYNLLDDHAEQLIERDSVLNRYADYLDKSNP